MSQLRETSPSQPPSPRGIRRSLKRRRKAFLAIVVAVFIAFAPMQAEAMPCSVSSTYQGTGWTAAYFCYGSGMIGPGASCVVVDGHYWVVHVYCPELAVVNVS